MSPALEVNAHGEEAAHADIVLVGRLACRVKTQTHIGGV
jgi:hypothetical protein